MAVDSLLTARALGLPEHGFGSGSSFALGDVPKFDFTAGLCHRKPLTGDGLVYTRTASQQGVISNGC